MKYFWFYISCFLFGCFISFYNKPKIVNHYIEIPTIIEQEKFSIYKTVCKITGYNPTIEQCDDTPNITASNKAVRLGMVAVSRDLEEHYKLSFGDYVYIKDLGLFEFQDRLHKRIKNQIDILCWNRKTAYKLTNSEQIVYFIKVEK